MATVVVWKIPEEKWMVDNHEGEERLFDDKDSAIRSACDMEKIRKIQIVFLYLRKMELDFQIKSLSQNKI